VLSSDEGPNKYVAQRVSPVGVYSSKQPHFATRCFLKLTTGVPDSIIRHQRHRRSCSRCPRISIVREYSSSNTVSVSASSLLAEPQLVISLCLRRAMTFSKRRSRAFARRSHWTNLQRCWSFPWRPIGTFTSFQGLSTVCFDHIYSY